MALTLVLRQPAVAQDTLRAAAVVNDQVISELDLAMRTRLAIISSGLPNTAEVQQRLTSQVLRSLIDEKLQIQEADRLDIVVEESELNQTIDGLASQNNMNREEFFSVLRRNQILPGALRDQVLGLMTWRALIQRRIVPSIDVSEEEIDAVVQRMQSSSGVEQVRVSEIFIGLDNPAQESEVANSAIRLVEQLRQGAEFGAMAQQFSRSSTASVGGDLGWIEPDQLSEELSNAVEAMQPGQIAGPIETFGGFYILLLKDRRRITLGERTVTLKQIMFELPENSPADTIAAINGHAQSVSEQVNSCEGLDQLAQDLNAPTPFDLGRVNVSDMPDQTQSQISALAVGEATSPIPVPGAVTVLVVCEIEDEGLNRNEIRNTLTRQRVDMQSRRYLRDLRRAANIDVRI